MTEKINKWNIHFLLFPLIYDVLIAFWDLESIVHRSVNFINVVIVNDTDFHETVDS